MTEAQQNKIHLTGDEENNVKNMVNEWQKLQDFEVKLANEKRAFQDKLKELNPQEFYIYNLKIMTQRTKK